MSTIVGIDRNTNGTEKITHRLQDRIGVQDFDIPNIPGVYLITCIPTRKVYVGSSSNLRKRLSYHRRSLEVENVRCTNRYLLNAYRKYGGSNFAYTILEFCNKEEIIPREKFWIDAFKSADRSHGFNIMSDPVKRTVSQETRDKMRMSKLGKKMSPESKRKLSIARKGKFGGAMNAFYGKPRSPETRAKISASHIGIRCGPRKTHCIRGHLIRRDKDRKLLSCLSCKKIYTERYKTR